MNKLLYIFIGLIIAMPTYATTNDNSRTAIQSRAMVGTVRMPPNKSSLKFESNGFNKNNVANADTNGSEPTPTPEPEPIPEPTPDNRDAERTACLANNIGIGNTFVWASRNSDTSNYATMIEDTENPENNVCFARVAMRSNDNRVDLSNIDPKYFPMGTNITCGEWTTPDALEKQILAATKSARTLATVAGSVGGAGVGVGAMELFGNKLLSNAVPSVMGQEASNVNQITLFTTQMNDLQKSNPTTYENIIKSLQTIKEACDADPSADGCKDPEIVAIINALNL